MPFEVSIDTANQGLKEFSRNLHPTLSPDDLCNGEDGIFLGCPNGHQFLNYRRIQVLKFLSIFSVNSVGVRFFTFWLTH